MDDRIPAPESEPAPWQRVSPVALVDFLVVGVRQGALQALPGLVVLYASASSSDFVSMRWVFLAFGALLLLGLVWSVLTYLRFGYRLRGARIDVRKGVLHRQTLNVEFQRIQNVSVQEPFYLRPFGKAVVGIDTAGSNSKEIRLPGIALEEAHRLRRRLVADARQAGAGDAAALPATGDGAPEGEGEVLLRLSRRDVVIAGLTANFMLWAAVAIGTILGSGETAERLVEWGVERLRLEEVIATLRAKGGELLVGLAIAGTVGLAVALLPVISVVGALFRYDGYVLRTDGDRFRRSSGMLSRHDDSVRQHKIQAVTWKQNAIALLFRRINLLLRQASAGSGAEASGQPGASLRPAFQVPSLHPPEAVDLTARFLPGCAADSAAFTGVDRGRYLVVSAGWISVPFALGLLPLAVIVDGRFALVWLLAAMVVVLIVNRCWRQTGWAVTGDHALFRKGFIGSSTTVFPLFKVQRVDLVQTPGQRRRGLAHLTVHLASHSVTMPWMRVEDAERFRDLALYRAESAEEDWF